MSFSTRTLALELDSLVRVTRRDGKYHFGKIALAPQAVKTLSGLTLFWSQQLHFARSSGRNSKAVHLVAPSVDPSALPLSSQRFQIFSLSFQSPFHLSFTVLVCYRSPIHIQLWKNHISHLGLQFQATRLFWDSPYSNEDCTGLLPSLANFSKLLSQRLYLGEPDYNSVVL